MTSSSSADLPDWSREEPHALWDPGHRLQQTICKYKAGGQRKGPVAHLTKRFGR